MEQKDITNVEAAPDLDETSQAIVELAKKITKGETTLQAEMGLTDEELEAMYMIAYNYYSQNKYAEARDVFATLLTFKPLEYKYCLGIASTHQMLEEYESAALFYVLSFALDQTQPAPHLHAAECLIKMNDVNGAVENLENAIRLAGVGAAHQQLKARANLMLNGINKNDE